MTHIAIIDYGSGNLHSIHKAVQRATDLADLSAKVTLETRPETLETASHVVLPGVGAFGDCKAGLSAIDGMIDALEEFALKSGKPFLGVCVGMQLLADTGLEHGDHKGLGWISGTVKPIKVTHEHMKIPHMGWNELEINQPHALFTGINDKDHCYFVHSYHFSCTDKKHEIAFTHYGQRIVAAIAKDNIWGVQFHPEKSQQIGLKLLQNFVTE